MATCLHRRSRFFFFPSQPCEAHGPLAHNVQ
nr:hypothetical protein SDXFZFDS_SDXFZFDS_CDS_0004 [Microvirus sp.]CAI9751866.1 hypothetical protein SDXFZFDS_SDXFZFDS_CDS_0006 [Microvirus sp.]